MIVCTCTGMNLIPCALMKRRGRELSATGEGVVCAVLVQFNVGIGQEVLGTVVWVLVCTCLLYLHRLSVTSHGHPCPLSHCKSQSGRLIHH